MRPAAFLTLAVVTACEDEGEQEHERERAADDIAGEPICCGCLRVDEAWSCPRDRSRPNCRPT